MTNTGSTQGGSDKVSAEQVIRLSQLRSLCDTSRPPSESGDHVPVGTSTPDDQSPTASGHADPRGRESRGRRFWAIFGTGTAALLATTAGLVIEYGLAKPIFEPSTNATPQPPVSSTPINVLRTSPTTEPASLQTTANASIPKDEAITQCRGAAMASRVKINPCITSSRSKLEVHVDLVAIESSVTMTTYVWLFDHELRKAVPGTLHRCEQEFASVGQTRRCGPHLVIAEPGKRYSASTHIEFDRTEKTPVAYTGGSGLFGTQSGAILWPPQ